jgi:hypothetical protein
MAPRKKKADAAGPAPPAMSKEWIDQFVSGSMSAEAVNAASMASYEGADRTRSISSAFDTKINSPEQQRSNMTSDFPAASPLCRKQRPPLWKSLQPPQTQKFRQSL